jgi:hypothetical protein
MDAGNNLESLGKVTGFNYSDNRVCHLEFWRAKERVQPTVIFPLLIGLLSVAFKRNRIFITPLNYSLFHRIIFKCIPLLSVF